MNYNEKVKIKLNEIKLKKDIIVLAIESSCDETAVAIIKNGREVLADVVYSSMDIFVDYGGVVPEIASRMHVEYLQPCIEKALKQANLTYDHIDAIGVTYGPGLVGALLTGVSCGKALAYALGLPLVGVNHIEGHICANYLTHEDLVPPFMCLIISGGHSHLVNVLDYNQYELIGRTRDDAVGEVYDKVARILGLTYPGGPNLEKLAIDGDPKAYAFPRALKGEKTYDFSFSGLKTAVINTVHQMEQKGESFKGSDVAASFQQSVCDVLVKNSIDACNALNIKTLAIAGGVSCNNAIRDSLKDATQQNGIKLYLPNPKWCTDNGAMIGCAGYYRLKNEDISDLNLNAKPSLQLCLQAE